MAFNTRYIQQYFESKLVLAGIPETNIVNHGAMRNKALQNLPSAEVSLSSGSGTPFMNNDPNSHIPRKVYGNFIRQITFEISINANIDDQTNYLGKLVSAFYRQIQDPQIIIGENPATITDYTDLSRVCFIGTISETYNYETVNVDSKYIETARLLIPVSFKEHINS